MCYERRRAEACVVESAHHALANAGGREIVARNKHTHAGSSTNHRDNGHTLQRHSGQW
jgi:hypothetical protein